MKRLLFGVNVSASAAPGSDPIGDSRRAEQAGFDFVSTNDHPGLDQPCFEAWTLLTWIAASTSMIAVLPRVLAVPLRLPAMVAKAAESLGRLSNGRLILGLGAGSSDEELDAYGSRALSRSEKITGLAETARTIRRLWIEPIVSDEGRVFRVREAHLEPKPAHHIPIWFGTFGPRALALTGRLADGWIPSLGYAPQAQLASMLATVREAAEEAGRDPDDVRCILNLEIDVTARRAPSNGTVSGSPEEIVERLCSFVEAGFGGFNFVLVGERSEVQVERLAGDVIPAVRRLAARMPPEN